MRELIRLVKLASKYYCSNTVIKITAEIRRLVRKELASVGGKARAKKYDHAILSKWAKLGGRPRKEKAK